ncbi:MAG TPA: DUF6134 family protein [Nitrospira sp.]|nr:DUF6134 family protein [Nitrospira sp.]
MMHRQSFPRWFGLAVAFAAGCLPAFWQPAWGATSQTYDFKVFLGNDEIGHQRFDVSMEGRRTRVRIDAQFTVKIFYIPVYRYRHRNDETWEDGCLREIQAETDDNGDSFFVRGLYRDGRVAVQTHSGNWSEEGCVKTFAYWNRDWITEGRLLNSQTGELQPAKLRTIGQDTISVHGVPTRTTHRQIITDKFTIDLWYTLVGKWVALQSTTSKGDILRYVLQ